MIRGYHLPGLDGVPTTTLQAGRSGDVRAEVPELTPSLLEEQIRRLVEARDRHLADRPVSEIVQAVDRVAERLLDPADELRRTADEWIPHFTGSSRRMTARILDGMAADWRAPRLIEVLRADLGDPAAMDGFVRRPGSEVRSRAIGPRLAVHVFSGNIPGVAVTSIIRSLLVKAATLGKSASGEPILAALFARGLAEVDAGLGSCLAVTYWRGGEAALERVAFGAADALIVYGGTAAIEAVRPRGRLDARFLAYGHKLSFGVVAREALTAEGARGLAERAALDVATFDQHGCVSPHLFYAERNGEVSPSAFAELLAGAMARLQEELPRGEIDAAEASAIRQLQGQAEFAAISGAGVRLHAAPGGTEWTVIFDPDPAFDASCLNRLVRVKPVEGLAEVAEHAREVGPLLQTVGVAGRDERLEPLISSLAGLGATRVAPIGEMAWPAPTWRHDGRPPIADLVRWCDWE